MNQRSLSTKIKHNSLINPRLISLKSNTYALKNKEEKLFGNKSFLEIILGLIKSTQNDVLSNKVFNKITGEFGIDKIKEILKELKQDLTTINEEEKKRLNLNENVLNEKKRKMKEIIYNSNYENHLILNPDNEIEVNLHNENFINENNDDDDSWKELYQLKTLNFKMENEINKVDNLYKLLLIEKNYVNRYVIINRFRKFDTIYIKQNDNKIVNQILHNKLITRRKLFIKKANMKNNQDLCINSIKDRINKFKKDLQDLYLYYNERIISEEEKSYIETIVEKMNNNCIDNDDEIDEDSINDEINKEIMKEEFDLCDKNRLHKDSSNNEEETCPNSSKNIE